MFGFKKKNYLKRTDFINSVDSNEIWSKTMTPSEIKELLGLMHHDGKKTVRHIEIEAELAVRASSKIEEQ